MRASNHSGYRHLTPEVSKRLRNDAIIRWIKPQLRSHSAYVPYMESKAKPQHIAEVIRQYHLVSEMLQEFSEMRVTADCGGPNFAPGSKVTSVRFGFNSSNTLLIYFRTIS